MYIHLIAYIIHNISIRGEAWLLVKVEEVALLDLGHRVNTSAGQGVVYSEVCSRMS